jgi:transposase
MAKRRKYSKEFKEEAVQMVSVPGVTLRQVAGDLGVSEGLLGKWKRELSTHGKKAFVGQGHARDEEMMQLRRELTKVKQERDFLKEAAAFFAKELK